jgi:hypothetical protein
MMQTSHFSSGALVGKLLPNPLLAFISGIILHFLIDKIPHWWPESKHARVVATIVDYLIAIIMLIVFIYLFQGSLTNMMWGLAGSAIVDIALVGIPAARRSKIGQWHYTRQPHKTDVYYLWGDVFLTIICLTLILQ